MPQKNLLNKNNILNIAFTLSVEITFTSLTTAPSLYPNIIYEWLILIAIYYINLLVTIFDLYLTPVLYPVSTTYEDEAIINIL
jgi:hypothetical protein